jgi:ribonuclease P protein component
LTAGAARCSNQKLFRTSPRTFRPDDETHFSTLEDPPSADARFPRPDEDGRRTQGAFGASRQGPRAAVRLEIRQPLNRAPASTATHAGTLPAGARAYRLSGPRAFEAIFRNGSRFEGRYVQIIATASAGLPGRAGFVLGRKALRRAVDRNRFRRCLREMLRGERPQSAALDLVVRLKRPLPPSEIPLALDEARQLLRTAMADLTAASVSAGVR